MPYRKALECKIRASDKLVKQLYSVHYMKRDYLRIEKSMNARTHNEQLLAELKE